MNDEEVLVRLQSPANLAKIVEEELANRRESNSTVLPLRKDVEERPNLEARMRALIGRTANSTDEQNKAVAGIFGVSDTQVSQYKRGLTSPKDAKYDPEQARLVKATAKVDNAHELALDAMVGLLGRLNEKVDAGEITSAKEMSRIATDMSRIAANIKGKERDAVINNTQVIMFAPNLKREAQYETIEVGS